MRAILLSIVSLLALVGCGAEDSASVNTVFDELNLELVTLEEFESSVAGAVGSLLVVLEDPSHPQTRYAFPSCSAVHFNGHYILTAAHCIRPNLVFDKSQIVADPLSASLSIHTFGDVVRLVFSGELIDQASSAINQPKLAEPLYVNEEYDFAIFELPENQILMSDRYLALNVLTKEYSGSVVAFGYPHGSALSVSKNCEGEPDISAQFFQHTCDTLNGHSGGLIVSTYHQPLGIHLAGPADNSGYHYEHNSAFESNEVVANILGCHSGLQEVDYRNCIREKGRNRAVLFSTVIRVLSETSPELYRAIIGDE